MERATRRRYRIWLALGLGHLVLVFLGAAYVDFSDLKYFGSVLGYYGMASGSGNSYGFFAPGISGQLRARFDVIDAKGKSTSVALTASTSHEASLRVGNIIDQFADDTDEDEDDDSDKAGDFGSSALHRSLSASLAGTVFEHHLEARKVMVRFEEFQPVSMPDYRRGVRPRWTQLYAARFSKKVGETR